ncbi:MAG: hypothetical protein ACFFF4_02360 [Candidatus Thorarchaeota archaeon]
MGELFSIVIFVAFMTLLLVLAYRTGALDELFYHPWRGSGTKSTQFLGRYQGVKTQKQHGTHNLD